jgi:hypothetical protein
MARAKAAVADVVLAVVQETGAVRLQASAWIAASVTRQIDQMEDRIMGWEQHLIVRMDGPTPAWIGPEWPPIIGMKRTKNYANIQGLPTHFT